MYKKVGSIARTLFILHLVLIGSLTVSNVPFAAVEAPQWQGGGAVIYQLSKKRIKIQSGEAQEVEVAFELVVENVYPNPKLPIALITTYDEAEVENSKGDDGAVMSQNDRTCESFIVDLTEGKKYPYEESCSRAISNIWSPDGKYALNGFAATLVQSSRLIELLEKKNVSQIQITGFDHGCGGVIDADSWRWISNNVVAFSGGACGTFLDYLFTVSSVKTEAYCSQFQKSRYGCPERSFLPSSDFKWRLLELRGGANYLGLKSFITLKQKELQKRYLEARTEGAKKRIVEESESFLFEILTDKIFPAWLGTPWSFNGTTRTPGQGSIACGTFVVYTLQDVGFRIPSKMARQPSENIIKNMIGLKKIKRFSDVASMERVKDWIVENGEGVYIVGLDIHVGFIKYKNDKISFLHSSYYDPPLKVVDQDIMENSPLTDSNYRVFGKILTDKMVVGWLTGENFSMSYNYFNQ